MRQYGAFPRSLIPIAFALGVCASVAPMLGLGVSRQRQSTSWQLLASSALEPPGFRFGLLAIEESPPGSMSPARCTIHRTIMKAELVPVRWGLPGANESLFEYLLAKKRSFPYCDDPIDGGCLGGSINEDFKDVCQDCNKARDQWLHGHRSKADH